MSELRRSDAGKSLHVCGPLIATLRWLIEKQQTM